MFIAAFPVLIVLARRKLAYDENNIVPIRGIDRKAYRDRNGGERMARICSRSRWLVNIHANWRSKL